MICDFGLGTTHHPLAVDRKIIGDLLSETHHRAQGDACGLQGLGRVLAGPAGPIVTIVSYERNHVRFGNDFFECCRLGLDL